MESAARHSGTGSDECQIYVMHDVPFTKQLTGADERAMTAVVSRVVAGAERSSAVPAMMFNSAI